MYKAYKEAFLSDKVGIRGAKKSWNTSVDFAIYLEPTQTTEIKKAKEQTEKKRFKNPIYLIKHYMTYSSVHGMRYIIDPKLYSIEKIFWLIFVAISISFTGQIIFTLYQQFNAAPTQVVIESTSYKVSSLPFPSVTLCPRDRVDWKKVLKIEKELIPYGDANAIQVFRQLMTTLSSLSFATFNELSFLKNVSLTGLQGINITDVLIKVVPDCKDILSSCWWRYDHQNCCEIFQVQKTEHGFCYSFNSALSEKKNFTFDDILRTSGYGDLSGLKFTLHLGNITSPPRESTGLSNVNSVIRKQRMQDLLRGATLFIQRPIVWSSCGQAIASGMKFSVKIRCTSGFATEDVLHLNPDKIPCRYSKENIYSQENCVSECRQNQVIKMCHCNPTFFLPNGKARDCNIKDLLCLIKHNDNFLNYQTPGIYVDKDGPVMNCNCPPACDYFSYETSMVALPIDEIDDIILDVHFESPTSIRYRTEVVFSTQDLLVSFGGIFCLFVGGSLFSIIELIYTCFVAVWSCFYVSLNFFKSNMKRKILTTY